MEEGKQEMASRRWQAVEGKRKKAGSRRQAGDGRW